MFPVFEDFVYFFNIEDFIIVTDLWLMTKRNIFLHELGNYINIIEVRIKNESNEINAWAKTL